MGARKSDKYQLLTWTHTNQTTSELMHNLNTFVARTSHRRTPIHKTHHSSNLGEATTFPLIVYFVVGHGTNIQMTFFPGFATGSPEIPKVKTLMTLGAYNYVCKLSIEMRSKENL
jgi:hypothetical protein